MRKQLPYIEILRKLNRAGVEKSPTINREVGNIDNIPTLQERINFLLGIVNKTSRPATNMLFFVMYDIASNKVRYHCEIFRTKGVHPYSAFYISCRSRQGSLRRNKK